MQTNLDLFTHITTEDTQVKLTLARRDMPLQSFQITLLKQPCLLFLPCTGITMEETHMTLTYDKGTFYHPFTQIQDCTDMEKYLLLLRIGKFLSDTQRHYSTSFDPRNIFYTHAFNIAFLLRILPGTQPADRKLRDEFEEYKALVLSVLQERYTFNHLIQYGIDILDKDEFCASIIDTQTPEELRQILTDKYNDTYHNVRKNRVQLPKKAVKICTWAASVLLVALFCTLGYFAYSNITQTRTYGNRMYIYENHFARNPEAVITYADKVGDTAMDPNLQRIVADALIATDEPENLKRAFPLDSSC